MEKIKLTLFLALLFCLAHVEAFAYDFYVDGIYYNFLSKTNKTVAVTCKGGGYYYAGNVAIPASVFRDL